MDNNILKHRNAVIQNIQKGFNADLDIQKGFDDELEKGKWNVGDTKVYQGITWEVGGFNAKGAPLWRKAKGGAGGGAASSQNSTTASTKTSNIVSNKDDNKNNVSQHTQKVPVKKGNNSPIGVTANSDELTNEDFFNILKYLKNECGINTSDVAKSPYGHEMKMYIDNEEFSVTKRAILTQNINNGYYQVVLKNRMLGEVNLQALYIENMSDVKLSFKTNDGNVQNVNLIDIINNDKSKIKNIDEEVALRNKKEKEEIEKIDVKKLSKPKAIKIAQNPNTPENILMKLLDSKHLDIDVKIAVTKNHGKGMTENVINKLLNSNEDLVRFRAIENLGPSVMELDKLREAYKKEKNNDLKKFIYKIGREKWKNHIYKTVNYPGFYMMGMDWV